MVGGSTHNHTYPIYSLKLLPGGLNLEGNFPAEAPLEVASLEVQETSAQHLADPNV